MFGMAEPCLTVQYLSTARSRVAACRAIRPRHVDSVDGRVDADAEDGPHFAVTCRIAFCLDVTDLLEGTALRVQCEEGAYGIQVMSRADRREANPVVRVAAVLLQHRIQSGIIVNIQEAVVIVVNKASRSPAPRSRHVVLVCHLSVRAIAVASEQTRGTEGRACVYIRDSVIIVIADVPCPDTARRRQSGVYDVCSVPLKRKCAVSLSVHDNNVCCPV